MLHALCAGEFAGEGEGETEGDNEGEAASSLPRRDTSERERGGGEASSIDSKYAATVKKNTAMHTCTYNSL